MMSSSVRMQNNNNYGSQLFWGLRENCWVIETGRAATVVHIIQQAKEGKEKYRPGFSVIYIFILRVHSKWCIFRFSQVFFHSRITASAVSAFPYLKLQPKLILCLDTHAHRQQNIPPLGMRLWQIKLTANQLLLEHPYNVTKKPREREKACIAVIGKRLVIGVSVPLGRGETAKWRQVTRNEIEVKCRTAPGAN